MTMTPEQMLAASKSNMEAAIAVSTSAVNSIFGALESLAALNLAAARNTCSEAVSFGQAAGSIKEPKDLGSLQFSLVQPSIENGVSYVKSLADIGTKVNDELTGLCEAESKKLVAEFNKGLNEMLKKAPAGSESAVEALKSVLAQIDATYANASKASKEAAATAKASFENAATAAIDNFMKSTQSAASMFAVAR